MVDSSCTPPASPEPSANDQQGEMKRSTFPLLVLILLYLNDAFASCLQALLASARRFAVSQSHRYGGSRREFWLTPTNLPSSL